jgi:hypothetical protein
MNHDESNDSIAQKLKRANTQGITLLVIAEGRIFSTSDLEAFINTSIQDRNQTQ